MLIDTHCHLDAAEFDGDRDAVQAAAWAVGVRQIIIPAVTVNGFSKTKMVAARYPGCVAAYGIHPLYVMQAGADDMAILAHWLEQARPIAVGEIGLDYFVPGLDPVRQQACFEAQLTLARGADLPVLLHVRRAVDAVLAGVRCHRVRGGIAHAFNGSAQQAEAFIKLGFKLGFGGAMTFSGSTRIRRLAAELPLESIVLETDAPDIPPAWLHGGRNTPDQLPAMARVLAELRGISVEQVMAQTTANARAVLPGLEQGGLQD